jgi:hypothetical protein
MGCRSITLTRFNHTGSFFLICARRVFRGKVAAGLESAFEHSRLHFSRDLTLLARPKAFASWLRPRFRKHKAVYRTHPLDGPEYTLQCLNRHTQGVASPTNDWSAGDVSTSRQGCRNSTCRLRDQEILSSNFLQTKEVPHYGRLVRCGTQVAQRELALSPRSSPLSPVVNRANGDFIRARHLQSGGRDPSKVGPCFIDS